MPLFLLLTLINVLLISYFFSLFGNIFMSEIRLQTERKQVALHGHFRGVDDANNEISGTFSSSWTCWKIYDKFVMWRVWSYRSVTEAHSAGFAFTQEQEVARRVLVGSADAAAAPTADFTGRVCFYKRRRRKNLQLLQTALRPELNINLNS